MELTIIFAVLAILSICFGIWQYSSRKQIDATVQQEIE